MRPWLITALLLLLAIPHQQWWQDYELARRGVLAILCGLALPGLTSSARAGQIPRPVWALILLTLWFLVRCLGVANQGYAVETAIHYLALTALVIYGTGGSTFVVLAAALPTGILVALVTLAQAAGWLLPLPGVHEVTATLGNLNTASELLAVCGAAAACLLATSEGEGRAGLLRHAALATLGLCSAAVVVNGSRSGMLALTLAVLVSLLGSRRRAVLLGLLAGAAIGWTIDAVREHPAAPTNASAPDSLPQAAPSTIAVRLALWRGGLAMVQERPLVGHGAGQFSTEYPRFRTREELELSSFNRRFLASPATAHNDYLQLLIEGGIPSGLLFALAIGMLLRRAQARYWGPLLAFAVLAGVRTPVGNAPAVALVCLFAGALVGEVPRPGPAAPTPALRYRLLRIVGVGAASALMLWLGCAQLLSQAAGAEMLEKRAAQRDAKGQLASVEAALRYRPYDHNFRQLHVQAMLRSGGDKLTTAREGIEKLRRERPHDTLVQWLWIELLRSEGKNRDAIQELEILRVRDPHDPKAILWTAEILVQLHQSPAAIVILYKNPQMRPHLALALRGLADFADKRGDTTDAALLRMEETFITVLDQMIARRYVAAQTQWKRFSKQMVSIDGDQKDPRTLILAAALYLSMNERAAAENLAAPARSRDPLSATHAALMEPVIEGLRDLPGWRELLPVTAVPR